jgi:catechol 2,3-dioxygenase-like lactoylglutathione lyase family enzyme
MKIKNIAFVGIPVTDIPRARTFYEEVLGLKVSDEIIDHPHSRSRAYHRPLKIDTYLSPRSRLKRRAATWRSFKTPMATS